MEKDEDYIRTVARLGGAVEELVRQNNAIDIYQEYFAGAATGGQSEVRQAALYKL